MKLGNLVHYFRILVRLGEYNFATDHDCSFEDCIDKPVDIPIEEVIVHEMYHAVTLDNDIALVKLVKTVNYTGKYNTAEQASKY